MRILVVGAGEVGCHIAARLVREKADVVLIDNDRERLSQVAENLDVQTVHGFGANPETLMAAGLTSADMLVAVTGRDETNVMACRLAQLLAPPKTRRMARIRSSGFYDFFDEERFRNDFGLNFIINPSQEAVETIMDFIEFPGVADVIDVARGRLRLVGLRLLPKNPLIGRPLAQILPRNQDSPNLLLAAIYRRHDLLIPRGDTILRAGDMIYVAAGLEDNDKVKAFFGLDARPVKNVVITGGGEVGLRLAKRLEADPRRFEVKLIELNGERCEYLSDRLARTMVIRGDGTDQELLDEEHVGDCGAFIALSTDDEKNMISCLVAKRLGAGHTITRVNRFSYAPLVAAIGLEAMVSARVAAASAVLKYIRKGQIISVATLAHENAEIIEFQVTEGSKVVHKRLMDLKFPEGALVCALTRGEEVTVPRGGAVIEAGDILAVVAKIEAIADVEKLLGGK
ncbi:MAG: Trk system potassium transporter TrkA [Candidatus Adiutrix sp.]|jgi:trk system potassium uptake protein TrkA|nr:Trk system potassium transporter TrkA [Candidatus Adiutrix sp.]